VSLAHRALGYRYEDAGWREEPVLEDGAFTSMSGLHTSARDYANYVSFLLDAWTDRNPAAAKIVAKPSRREFAQASAFPASQAADAAGPTSVYGFGMRFYSDCRFRHSFGHSGGLPGYGSNVLLIPEHDIASSLSRTARMHRRRSSSGRRQRCCMTLALKAVNNRGSDAWCASSRPARRSMRLDR
jgi:hypothetical protein